jgi:hypothetical protein
MSGNHGPHVCVQLLDLAAGLFGNRQHVAGDLCRLGTFTAHHVDDYRAVECGEQRSAILQLFGKLDYAL